MKFIRITSNLRTILLLTTLVASAKAGVENPPPPPVLPTGPSPDICYSDPPPYFGDNPTVADIKAKLIAAGQRHQIPPQILFGMAYQESGWRQFRSDRRTVYHLEKDCRVGVGMMQITVLPSVSEYADLCQSIDYNIERGAQILDGKWNATPIIGDNSRTKLENWYYAVWAYNGFVCPNPNDYANKVWANIAANPLGIWQAVTLSKPSQTCPVSQAPEPQPVHIDANFDGIIDNTPPDPCAGLNLSNLYVDFGWGSNTCGTSANPFNSLQTALVKVNAGGTINLKSGGSVGGMLNPNGKTVTIQPNSGSVTLGP